MSIEQIRFPDEFIGVELAGQSEGTRTIGTDAFEAIGYTPTFYAKSITLCRRVEFQGGDKELWLKVKDEEATYYVAMQYVIAWWPKT